jgi:hypothetical protein
LNGEGTVFELIKGSGGYTLSTLFTFSGSDVIRPRGDLIADGAGNLFGTASGGNNGRVFELIKGSGGYTLSTLARLDANAGITSYAGLIADSAGNLFGTGTGGGYPSCLPNCRNEGTVFQVTGSGFVIPDSPTPVPSPDSPTPVPAPSGLGLFGMGLAALGLVHRRRSARWLEPRQA